MLRTRLQIVIVCVACVAATLAVWPRIWMRLGSAFTVDSYRLESKRKIAWLMGKEFTNAHAKWSADHFDRTCPETLSELLAYARKRDLLDPWRTEFRMFCDATNVEFLSAGPDRKFGTADDISSRERLPK